MQFFLEKISSKANLSRCQNNCAIVLLLVTSTIAVIIDWGGPGWPAAARVPVLPNLYVGITAALGAGVLAYLLCRRITGQKTAGI